MRARIISIAVLLSLILFSASAAAFETTPEDGETGFPVDGEIIIEFDYPMDTETMEVDISPDPVYPVQRIWSNNDRILTLRPTVDLLPHRTYSILVTGENNSGHFVYERFDFETEFYPEEDRRPYLSGIIIPIFIILAIVTVIAIYFTMKGIHQKKGQ